MSKSALYFYHLLEDINKVSPEETIRVGNDEIPKLIHAFGMANNTRIFVGSNFAQTVKLIQELKGLPYDFSAQHLDDNSIELTRKGVQGNNTFRIQPHVKPGIGLEQLFKQHKELSDMFYNKENEFKTTIRIVEPTESYNPDIVDRTRREFYKLGIQLMMDNITTLCFDTMGQSEPLDFSRILYYKNK